MQILQSKSSHCELRRIVTPLLLYQSHKSISTARSQDELNALTSTEKITREKMLYFKRELENRETNFNTRFSTASLRTSRSGDGKTDSAGVLRVIQNPSESKDSSAMPNAPKKKQSQTNPTRRKGSIGSKKKVVTSKKSSTSLPKLAKPS
jgi:hypothetical protein